MRWERAMATDTLGSTEICVLGAASKLAASLATYPQQVRRWPPVPSPTSMIRFHHRCHRRDILDVPRPLWNPYHHVTVVIPSPSLSGFWLRPPLTCVTPAPVLVVFLSKSPCRLLSLPYCAPPPPPPHFFLVPLLSFYLITPTSTSSPSHCLPSPWALHSPSRVHPPPSHRLSPIPSPCPGPLRVNCCVTQDSAHHSLPLPVTR